jgi:hypothetical protein
MRCRSYFVTYDPTRPHGCRAFLFQSARLPSLEVRLTTGEDCRAWTPRSRPSDGAPAPEAPWTSD